MKYKKYETIWFAVAILLLAAAVYLPWQLHTEAFFWAVISCTLAAAITGVFTAVNLKSWRDLSGWRASSGVQDFIDRIQELINTGKIFKRTRIRLQFMLVDALLDAGRFDQAFMILQTIDIKKGSHFSYLKYSVKYHIYMEDKNAAETELILLGIEAEKHKKCKRKYREFKKTCTDLQNRLMFLKKDYAACADYFSGIYGSPFSPPYEKVFAAYCLGVMALENNELERAKEYLHYTADYGNTLFITHKAGQQLEMIGAAAV